MSGDWTVQVWLSGLGLDVARRVDRADAEGVLAAARPVYSSATLQAVNAALSSEHSKRHVRSPEANSKLAEVALGRGRRLVGDDRAGRRGVDRPRRGRPASRRCCPPRRSPAPGTVRRRPPGRCTACGELQAVNAAPSSEHSKLEPASLAVKPKLPRCSRSPRPDPASIVVCGAVPSTSRCRSPASGRRCPRRRSRGPSSVCCPAASAAGSVGRLALGERARRRASTRRSRRPRSSRR